MDNTPHDLDTILGNAEGGEEDPTCLNDSVIKSWQSGSVEFENFTRIFFLNSLRGLSPGYNNTMRIFAEVGKPPLMTKFDEEFLRRFSLRCF